VRRATSPAGRASSPSAPSVSGMTGGHHARWQRCVGAIAVHAGRLFVVQAALVIITSLAAHAAVAPSASAGDSAALRSAALRWEATACALDHVVGVEHAWGIVSALRNAPTVLEVPTQTARVAAAASVLVRAAADAFFVPVDECAVPLAAVWRPRGDSQASVSKAQWLECARGISLMMHAQRDRFERGFAIDQIVGAAAVLALDGGDPRELPLRALSVGLAVSAPGGGTLGYFLVSCAEHAWHGFPVTLRGGRLRWTD